MKRLAVKCHYSSTYIIYVSIEFLFLLLFVGDACIIVY